jgi:uncharacterized membrane protein YqjE
MARWKDSARLAVAIGAFLVVPLISLVIWPGDYQWLKRLAIIAPAVVLAIIVGLPKKWRGY